MVKTVLGAGVNKVERQPGLYTDLVLFFFLFFSKTSASARERKILLPPLLPPVRWRSINPLRFFILSPALDGLWRENRGSVNFWEFLCCFKIISLRNDWYLKENFNRSDRFEEFKLLLITGDGQPSFVTLVQKRGQFSLRSVGLPWFLLWLA